MIINIVIIEVLGKKKMSNELVNLGIIRMKNFNENELDDKFFELIEGLGEEEVFKYDKIYGVERSTKIALSIAFVDCEKEYTEHELGMEEEWMDYVFFDCIEIEEHNLYRELQSLDYNTYWNSLQQFYK